MSDQQTSVLELFRRRTLGLALEHGLTAEMVDVVSARPLTPEEAIGKPERGDFPILKGKELMMEARFRGSRGQAFTSMPGEFQGTVEEALTRPFETDFDRALVVATGNAVLGHLGVAGTTVHCRDDGPKQCAAGIAEYVREHYGSPKIAFVGFQPALIEALAREFDMRVTDMDPANVGQASLGVTIEGAENTAAVIDWADVVLVTGTTLANDTLDGILSDKPTLFYGVTSAGLTALFGYERYCPQAV